MQFADLAVVEIYNASQGIENKFVLVIKVSAPFCLEKEVETHTYIPLERSSTPLRLSFPLIGDLDVFSVFGHIRRRKASSTRGPIDILRRFRVTV